jgi:hypothetical protein
MTAIYYCYIELMMRRKRNRETLYILVRFLALYCTFVPEDIITNQIIPNFSVCISQVEEEVFVNIRNRAIYRYHGERKRKQD